MKFDSSNIAESVPLYVKVKEDIRSQILDGTYQPLAKLPSEHQLCDLFQVSRITVRQALNDLQRDGLIHKMHGRGTFVSKSKASQNISYLQGFTEAMSPLGHTVTSRLHGFRYLHACETVSTQLALPLQTPVAEITRVRLLDDAPVSFEITYVPRMLGERLAASDLVNRDMFGILEKDFDIEIAYAEVTMNAVSVLPVMIESLQMRANEPVLRIDRQVFDRDNKPFLYEQLYFRSSIFQYKLRVERASDKR
jgi:GntR family transcriptional regulator